MFILDTNVVSELRKAKAGMADHNVTTWATRTPASALYLSVVTILELEIGVLTIERRDRDQGAVMRSWMNDYVLPAFSGRILSIDSEIAIRCANLHVPDRLSERDALIAATALVHRMTIVTRNVADFSRTKAAIVNPWQRVN